MRWFARRLAFYVFAIWVALTINFLLPRLMPGSPLGGLLQHLTPSQLSANPGIVQTYQALLGGGHHSIWADYVTYLHRIAHFDFGISTSNYPTPVSEVVGRTLPYSMFLVVLAYAGGWVLNMRTVMITTIGEDYVTMAHAKGLRDRRVMTRYAGRNAILPPLNGFAALFASAVGGLVFIEYIFSYPGAGLSLQSAVLGSDYPLAQAILVVLSVCVILANLLMDVLNFVLDPRLRTG